uniref:hypothetical protein n=1 Tax=uncultured Caulobacter sp. TaxID=158749 RepID=UPI0025E50DED|nr:hypothetical protein [uncultured Caulobacter sp.]
MKVIRAAIVVAIMLAPTVSLASQACEECAKKVQAAYAKCMQDKKDQVTCNKEQQAAALACANGPCKK